MKKLLSLLLIVFMLLSVTACKNGKNNGDSSGSNGVLSDENANANEIMPLIFCYNISQLSENLETPAGWYALSAEKQKANFLKAYESSNQYYVPENADSKNKRTMAYLLIDDIVTLSDVIKTTGQYSLADVYPSNILDDHFIIAVLGYSGTSSDNFVKYGVEFDETTKVLTLKEQRYDKAEYSTYVECVSYSLDLIPVKKSVLKDVPLSDITAVYEKLGRVPEDSLSIKD